MIHYCNSWVEAARKADELGCQFVLIKGKYLVGSHEELKMQCSTDMQESNICCPPKKLKRLADEAMQVQDACNLLGVSKSFAVAIQQLKERLEMEGLPNDTNAIRYHPISQAWAFKIRDLCDDPEVDGNQYIALRKVRELIE